MTDDDASAFDPPSSSSSPLAPVHDLPCKFGSYRLEERLGVGGMAEVFLATRLGGGDFERPVVVKKILPHLAQNPIFKEMFFREAKIVAGLSHPNIVSVYDFGNEEGAYFIAMEYVEGLSLRDIRRRCKAADVPVPIDVAVRAIADAALALDLVHRKKDKNGVPLNLVHRDISPDNIILSKAGVAKLLDFGIARSDDEKSLTQTGELKGKIPYMPPEQISGETVDGRSDLYALGASLYTLICGRRPIEAKTDLLALSAILKTRPVPPRALRADVPIALELVILRLLEKKKERRIQTGQDVHDALLRAVPSATIPDLDAIAALEELSEFEASDTSQRKLSSESPAHVRNNDAKNHGKRDELSGPRSTPATTSAVRLETIDVDRFDEKLNDGHRGEKRAGASLGPDKNFDDNLSTEMLVRKMNQGERKVAALGGLLAGLLVTSAVVVGIALMSNGEDGGDSRSPPLAKTEASAGPNVGMKQTGDVNDSASTASNSAASNSAASNAAKSAVTDNSTAGKVATKRKARRKRKTTESVRFEGPAQIRWVAGGKTVARGTASGEVRAKTRVVMAVDDRKSARIPIKIENGVAKYKSVKSGTLSVRVLPFAKVYLGRTFIGETPLAPFRLPAGTYDKVRFVGESRSETRKVKIQAGALQKVKVDLTK